MPAHSPQARSLQLGDLPTQLQQQGIEAHRLASCEAEPTDQSIEVLPLAEIERKGNPDRHPHPCVGDKLLAARLLGIGKTTLYRKLKEYGITDPMLDS